MIAGCIDKMRDDGCGGCVRRNACASLFAGLFRFGAEAERPKPAASRRARAADSPFLAFLGDVAKAVERHSAPRPTPLRDSVERQIEPLLATGEVRAGAVARALGLSRQTLYRRLKSEGATFEEILEALRRRLALRMIRDEGLPVKEAAWRLGFSDPAAFSRAYKRWTGASPRGPRPQSG